MKQAKKQPTGHIISSTEGSKGVGFLDLSYHLMEETECISKIKTKHSSQKYCYTTLSETLLSTSLQLEVTAPGSIN
jgi:hypothetical protein